MGSACSGDLVDRVGLGLEKGNQGMGKTYVIDLPWPRPPLSLNQRLHWAKQAKLTKDVRLTARLLARHIPEMSRCSVEMVWHVADKRRRDADNPVLTLKALCDGLVDAEIVPDDTPEFMAKLPVRIVNSGSKKVELHVKELEANDE